MRNTCFVSQHHFKVLDILFVSYVLSPLPNMIRPHISAIYGWLKCFAWWRVETRFQYQKQSSLNSFEKSSLAPTYNCNFLFIPLHTKKWSLHTNIRTLKLIVLHLAVDTFFYVKSQLTGVYLSITNGRDLIVIFLGVKLLRNPVICYWIQWYQQVGIQAYWIDYMKYVIIESRLIEALRMKWQDAKL